jgi:hypothetical protein
LLWIFEPPRRDMVRPELHAKPPLAVDDDALKGVVLIDRAIDGTRPERVLGGDISGIETQ